MVERHTEGSLSLFCTTFTRMSSTSSFNLCSATTPYSQVKCSMRTTFTRCITSLWHPCRSCGMPFTTLSLKKIGLLVPMTAVKTPSTCLEILFSTRLVWITNASAWRSSLFGSCTQSTTLRSSMQATCTFSCKRMQFNLMVKTLGSGSLATPSMDHAFSLSTLFLLSDSALTPFPAFSCSS